MSRGPETQSPIQRARRRGWMPVAAAATFAAAAIFGITAVLGAVGGDTVGRVGKAAPSPSPDASSIRAGNYAVAWPRTDFSRHTVPIDEIFVGCAGRDCIPALDAKGATTIASTRPGTATFAPVSETHYAPDLPVAVVEVHGDVRAYPLHVLTWHEVVNDVIGGVPVVVTFCPLCNTAVAFDRRVEGKTLDFGVSGMLRNSDLVMWDRQTESWWQQAERISIVGTYAGTRLSPIASPVVSFGDFARDFPKALVLSENTGLSRAYGVNPYAGYDHPGTSPFLFNGTVDPRLDGLQRVVGFAEGTEPLAVPFEELAKVGAANLRFGTRPVVVFWAGGTRSVLDKEAISESKDVGAAVPYEAVLDGTVLSFRSVANGSFRDDTSGSTWDINGLAVAGPLAGKRLQVAPHTSQFWFAWAAFHHGTAIWRAP